MVFSKQIWTFVDKLNINISPNSKSQLAKKLERFFDNTFFRVSTKPKKVNLPFNQSQMTKSVPWLIRLIQFIRASMSVSDTYWHRRWKDKKDKKTKRQKDKKTKRWKDKKDTKTKTQKDNKTKRQKYIDWYNSSNLASVSMSDTYWQPSSSIHITRFHSFNKNWGGFFLALYFRF